MNISEFERVKPAKTYSKITTAIAKYEKIIMELPIMDDEDAIKVEMAADFASELQKIKKSFLQGQ